MNLSGAKVLVIGGAGFIGSHVVEELLAEPLQHITVFDNFDRGKQEYIAKAMLDPRCSIFPDGGDIREIDVLDRAVSEHDFVVHLAAKWLLHSKEYPRTAFDVNVGGTFNVLEACVKHNVQKLVFSSSASVYGDALEVPMTESHPFNNRNFYGATKIAGEAMARAFNDRYGLDYVGLRYMNVYGPHQDQTAAYTGVIPIMLNKIQAGEPPRINGDGSQAYDFISVRDVARANVISLKSEVSDSFFNVGTGVQTTVRELCDLILKLTDSSLEVDYVPYPASDVRQFVQNRIGDTAKAESELGFSAQIPLEEGLRDLIKWRYSEH